MTYIIGIDFGNYNTFPSVITDLEEGTRIGGTVHDLLPAVNGVSRLADGIPSVFFYSKKRGVVCGEAAMRATPSVNRRRYLKRSLSQSFSIEGKEFSCEEAVAAVMEYVMAKANERLSQHLQAMTNLIYLAYPAGFDYVERNLLVQMVEKAKVTVNGQQMHVKVVGTIAEPAAAALDYLSQFGSEQKATTVLTLDCGGGTTDVSLLAAYPQGKKNPDGNVIYYDSIDNRGINQLGGREFDALMEQLIRDAYQSAYPNDAGTLMEYFNTPRGKKALESIAEETKIELGTAEMTTVEMQITNLEDEYASVEITKKEFEKAIRNSGLLDRIVDLVREMMTSHPSQQPDLIVLTGGSCQIPIMQKALKEAFPKWKDKIKVYRPSRAISYGAARFGAVEGNPDGRAVQKMVVQRHLPFDIGARFYTSLDDSEGFIVTYLKAGTPIPCESKWLDSHTLKEHQKSYIPTWEASVRSPDRKQVKRDYHYIMTAEVDHGRVVPANTNHESRMIVDQFGNISFEARIKGEEEVLAKVKSVLASLQERKKES